MDDFKNELKELNSNLERIAKSLERTEALNEQVMPFITAYIKLLDACGIQNEEMIEKISYLFTVGINQAYDENKEYDEED